MQASNEGRWHECVVDRDYEICEDYPHELRRKGQQKTLKLSFHKRTGYLQVHLNGKFYNHHRLVALQFIPNDDPIRKVFVDHINHDRTDNHIANLRWCTASENNRNKASSNGRHYTFLVDIDESSIVVDKYGARDIENLYYDPNLDQFFLKLDENHYRIIEPCTQKGGAKYINVRDTDNKRFMLYIHKWKASHNID